MEFCRRAARKEQHTTAAAAVQFSDTKLAMVLLWIAWGARRRRPIGDDFDPGTLSIGVSYAGDPFHVADNESSVVLSLSTVQKKILHIVTTFVIALFIFREAIDRKLRLAIILIVCSSVILTVEDMSGFCLPLRIDSRPARLLAPEMIAVLGLRSFDSTSMFSPDAHSVQPEQVHFLLLPRRFVIIQTPLAMIA